jgi:putative membrane protein (TIGR04086 family)
VNSFPRFFGLRNASPVVSGLYWSSIWLAIGAIVLSILLFGTSMSENRLFPWVYTVHGFSSLAGGFVSARRSGKRGWYYGMTNGFLYTLLILVISFLATDAHWTSAVAVLLALTCLAGAFGGMLGVNSGNGPAVKR